VGRGARNLHSTNNFPEFTGRICPAPCEASCTLNIDDTPVTIKTIECAIVDAPGKKAGSSRRSRRARPARRSPWSARPGRPGLRAAAGARRPCVHVFEKFAKAGGLLRYGIPDFKMEKHLIDRRVAQMEAEGVTFHYGVACRRDVSSQQLLKDYDAVVLSGGAESRAICRSRAATWTAFISPWIPAAAEPPRRRGRPLDNKARSRQAASMSW
jgi:glutamate synthase (NADPH/NADH) small chain